MGLEMKTHRVSVIKPVMKPYKYMLIGMYAYMYTHIFIDTYMHI